MAQRTNRDVLACGHADFGMGDMADAMIAARAAHSSVIIREGG
jgi:hypothetical protein